MEDIFDVVFVEGVDYEAHDSHEVAYFEKTIKDSFSLLSWLISDYQIRILDEIILDQDSKIQIFSQVQSQRLYSLRQRRHGESYVYALGMTGVQGKMEEFRHRVISDRPEQSIKVVFRLQDEGRTFIIRAACQRAVKSGLAFRDVFINKDGQIASSLTGGFNYFKPPCIKLTDDDGDYTDIQYYYLEPQNRRFFAPKGTLIIILGYHLSIALQGGGVKGVSYVGVYKALRDLQARIQRESLGNIPLPITSVIGSSAGAILSLAISAGITEQDSMDVCYMMDNFVQDRLFPKADETNQDENDLQVKISDTYEDCIEAHYFKNQGDAIKNMLHNLGFMQDSLTDIIFDTLKQPSVQGKIVDLLRAVNPTIASLLTFDDTQKLGEGETIKNCCGSCCCCCYSNCLTCCGMYPCCKSIPGSSCFVEDVENLKRINIKGLLYAGLMTGTALEDVLVYALSRLFGIKAEEEMRNLEADKNYAKKLAKLAERKGWFGLKNYDGVLKMIADESRKLLQSYRNRANDKDFNYLKNPLMPYAKQLTLEQYYQITGVQFTVTSVDLHDKIERFFNHKTTPHLPVCKSIQMSGSFPIAFLSLSWKKEWGKYYIHYEKSRREIDLTGHKFTDGGLLANFPLKFLDNQKFREKYFSHENVPGKTLLYGFGLDKLDEFPEKDRSQQVSEKMGILVGEIKYRIMYKLMFYLVQSGSKATKQIKNSKVVDYLLSLHEALKESDRNLNRECFNNEIIKTVFKREVIAHRSKYNYIEEYSQKILREFKASFDAHYAKQYDALLREQFDAIYDRYSEYEDAVLQGMNVKQLFRERMQWRQIEYIQLRIEDNLLIFSPDCIVIYQSRLAELKQMYSNADPFVTSATPHHQLQILRLLYDIKKSLAADSSRAPKILAIIKNNFMDFMAEFKDICMFQVEKIRSTTEDSKLESNMYIDHVRIRNLITLMYKLSPFSFKMFKKLSKPLMQNIPIISYYIQEQSILKKDFIRYKLKKLINQNKIRIEHERKLTGNTIPTQLHIIFQSHYFSHYFYPNYMKIVEEVIANKDLNINIISCTNYHAIFGVFYVMGLDTGTIKYKLSQIQGLFEENFRLNKDYDSKEWLKSSLVQVRNLMAREWKRQRDPFEQIQLQYFRQNQSYSKLEESNFNNVQHKHSAAGQQMNDTFEKILNYVSGSMDELYHLPQDKRQDRFKQLLGIGEYRKINEKRSQNGQRIMEHFLYYTADFFMIAAEYTLKNQQYIFANSQKWDRQTMFRGLILDSLISAFMYKVYIFDLLAQAGFDENITLSKFSQACSHKILLNFNCVNTTQQRFSVLNKLTHPNMPLWAALMACASLPYLHGQFASRKEWELKENPDQNLEKADAVFENIEVEGTNRGNNYISGNFISRLPLQFMTNRRLINSKLTAQPNTPVIQIVFSFETTFQAHAEPEYQNLTVSQLNYNKQVDQKSLTASLKFEKMLKTKSMLQIFANEMQGKRKFINCWDMIGYLCEFICCCCCNAEVGSYFGDLLGRLNVLKMVGLRFSSHDNLILHLYYDILIKVPLRIDTLQFYKVTRSMPDFPQAVRQSRQVVRELCDTIQVDPSNPSEIYFTTPKNTSIEFYLLQSPIYNNNEPFYRIKFISYTKWRNYKYKYAIEFSEHTAGINNGNKFRWRVIQSDYVDVLRSKLEMNDYKVMVKYTFYENKLFSNIYMLDLRALTHLQKYPAAGMITFSNREIGCAQVSIQLADKQHTPLGKILVKSTNIHRSSRHCSNPECTARRLVYVLMQQRREPCFECERQEAIIKEEYKSQKQMGQENPQYKYKKKHITAMRCLQCKANYCIKCKISLFIVREKRHVGGKSFYEYICPMNPQAKRERYQLKFAPIRERCLGEGEIVKNNCHYCEKYSFDLWHEQGIVLGAKPRKEFCGLRICETCSLYISE